MCPRRGKITPPPLVENPCSSLTALIAGPAPGHLESLTRYPRRAWTGGFSQLLALPPSLLLSPLPHLAPTPSSQAALSLPFGLLVLLFAPVCGPLTHCLLVSTPSTSVSFPPSVFLRPFLSEGLSSYFALSVSLRSPLSVFICFPLHLSTFLHSLCLPLSVSSYFCLSPPEVSPVPVPLRLSLSPSSPALSSCSLPPFSLSTFFSPHSLLPPSPFLLSSFILSTLLPPPPLLSSLYFPSSPCFLPLLPLGLWELEVKSFSELALQSLFPVLSSRQHICKTAQAEGPVT